MWRLQTHPEASERRKPTGVRELPPVLPFWLACRILGHQADVSQERKCSLRDTNRLFGKTPKSMHIAMLVYQNSRCRQKFRNDFVIVEEKHTVPLPRSQFFLKGLQEVAIAVGNIRSKSYKWGNIWSLLLKNTQRIPVSSHPRFSSWDFANDIASPHRLTKSSSLGDEKKVSLYLQELLWGRKVHCHWHKSLCWQTRPPCPFPSPTGGEHKCSQVLSAATIGTGKPPTAWEMAIPVLYCQPLEFGHLKCLIKYKCFFKRTKLQTVTLS